MIYRNILLLGGNGMLGNDLQQVLKDYSVTVWDSEHNIAAETIIDAIVDLNPDLIINCAAFTDVDGCEDNKLCYQVNGRALQYLAQATLDLKIPIVHFSTDYVFDGKNESGYDEAAESNPINEYGFAKQLGESFLFSLKPDYYLIRTAWLYGSQGKNFIDTIKRLAHDAKDLKVVNDQHGAPTWTVDLAHHVKRLIESNVPFGVYHFAAEGDTTWFEVAKYIVEKLKLSCEILPQTTKESNRQALRPEFSKLINTKFIKMRHWKDMLDDYLRTDRLMNE